MRALIASCYAVIGLVLSFALDRSFERFSAVIRQPWYESLWMPLWVAGLTFVVAGIWVRLPARVSAILGLLVTAPPYGWLLVKGGEDGFSILLVCLAASGAILNPLIAGCVSLVGRRSHEPGAPQGSQGARV